MYCLPLSLSLSVLYQNVSFPNVPSPSVPSSSVPYPNVPSPSVLYRNVSSLSVLYVPKCTPLFIYSIPISTASHSLPPSLLFSSVPCLSVPFQNARFEMPVLKWQICIIGITILNFNSLKIFALENAKN